MSNAPLLNTDFMIKTFFASVKAIPVTLEITLLSIILAAVPSYAIAMSRIRKRPLHSIGTVYVSFMRGTPILLQILIVYSILPGLLNSLVKKFVHSANIFDMNPIVYAIVVFTLNTIATLSEVFRSAMGTVDKGQYEAALSAGLSHTQAYVRIVIPHFQISAILL